LANLNYSRLVGHDSKNYKNPGETAMSAQQIELDRRIMRVLVECTTVQTASEFTGMTQGTFRLVLPLQSMLCGTGGISRQGNHIRKIVNVDYPLEYFEPLRDGDGRLDSPLMKRWRETREPQLFQSGRDDHLYRVTGSACL
jgi:hypothetical protein